MNPQKTSRIFFHKLVDLGYVEEGMNGVHLICNGPKVIVYYLCPDHIWDVTFTNKDICIWGYTGVKIKETGAVKHSITFEDLKAFEEYFHEYQDNRYVVGGYEAD